MPGPFSKQFKDNKQFFLLACEKQPLLKALERDIKMHAAENRKNDPYCANAPWVREFKPRLTPLVGWETKTPELATEEAYDKVYEYLYELLPDCKNCFCGPL